MPSGHCTPVSEDIFASKAIRICSNSHILNVLLFHALDFMQEILKLIGCHFQ